MGRYTSSVGLAVTLVFMAAACGGGPPTASKTAPAPPPGNAEELKALDARQVTAPGDAVAGLEAYVSKYPADPEGHSRLGSAIQAAITALPRDYTDADRAALERSAQHYRKVLELTSDEGLRAASYMALTTVYGPAMLGRPEEVIEPATQLIAMSAMWADPHFRLADALASLKRTDEAVEVWRDGLKTLRVEDRRSFAVWIGAFANGHPELTDAHVQTLVAVLTAIAGDAEHPNAPAHAVALTLRGHRLEKDPAARDALLQQAASWQALVDKESHMSPEEVKAMIADLKRRSPTPASR